MELPKITISPNAFRVNGQDLIVMHNPEPTIRHIGSNIYGLTVTIPSDDIGLDADARYRYKIKYAETDSESADDVEPLDSPAGTPFLASVCGGLPQLVVRTHSVIDLEAWWFLNGTRWLRTDDCDVEIIAPLKTDQ
ncbi:MULTISPECIES: hypothetical protein [Corynebacterium]|uniref:hypothetical protein n=1 Tax=Corynebacterium TaxID=1716 RepID=UPI0003B831A8|nr:MULTISPECIES: hypothetical protein [Corynebacterium]ERS41846.1 hypothetical protein HMPREF1293_01997 [Corynebacterium sp. KPL1996]ERS44675.1 hypothetical protein HMPREF1287_01168 [Corynebacterium sp. KPL1986]ERS72600.1 hypothetical protein HMPREF1295_01527 [Corynebacterium sp. KPL1998]ERS73941.1 hypothetical protein HMPREF1300_00924 [Corynebacterium sp. KPL2004]MCT1410025.1 hypothetical protein [Corynebacterium accolens]